LAKGVLPFEPPCVLDADVFDSATALR